MIGKITAEVNRSSIAPALTLSSALDAGYQFTLSSDGNCEVSKPDGAAYYIVSGQCNCPDKQRRGGSYNGRCKHEIFCDQITPCAHCDGTMALGTSSLLSCDGKVEDIFICPGCNNARMASLVAADRRIEAALRGDYDEEPEDDGRYDGAEPIPDDELAPAAQDGDSAPATCEKCGVAHDDWDTRCEQCGAPVGLHGRLAEAGELEAYMARRTSAADAERMPF